MRDSPLCPFLFDLDAVLRSAGRVSTHVRRLRVCLVAGFVAGVSAGVGGGAVGGLTVDALRGLGAAC